MFTFIEKFKRD